jgi:glutathionylspermidine synthase
MQRCITQPRANWQATVESQGLFFHTADGVRYWDEHVFYEFTAAQIDTLEAATDSLNQMCLETVQHLVDHRDETFPNFGIPEEFWDFVTTSWEEDEHTIYGRFDFGYDGVGDPKLLEFNADTPTSLLEAAVIQYYWMKDLGGNYDQFNSIHEKLIEVFERVKNDREITVPFFLTSLGQDDSVEDFMTATYLRDVAVQAGLDARYLKIEDIGYCPESSYFLDSSTNEKLEHLFKLYPWEWLFREEFGANLLTTETEWYEPAWKSLLSNKALLPYLYDLFGDSPYVLKASFDIADFGDTYVRKPIFSREGQNVYIVKNGTAIADTPGEYDEFPVIYQEYSPLPTFAGNCPVIGSWLVNGYAAGVGIRETQGLVTNNTSRFVPHRFVPAAAKGKFGAIRKKLLGK